MSGALLVGTLTFLAATPMAVPLIRWLLGRGAAKRIRTDGPASHESKRGTATMGGLLLAAVGAITGIVMLVLGHQEVLWPLLAMVSFGVLGTFDDLKGLKDVQGVGWLARAKFPWQWMVAISLALLMYVLDADRALWLPFTTRRLDLGIWFIPIAALLMVWWVNATNLADGLDGLAGGMGAIVLGTLAVLAIGDGPAPVGYWAAALAGGTLAFLWHNVHPARLFMGDIGAEALGASMAAIALVTGHGLLLLVAGSVFVAEALSVMMQVGYFKFTRRRYGTGRRIFRMTPLHHHFEQLGWNEVQITQRFWIVTVISAMLALALWGTAVIW